MKFFKLLPGLVIAALLLSGCGGGGGNSGGSNPSKIVITPGSPLVFYEGTQKFTAVLTDTTGNVIPASFTWSVEPGTSSGTITTDGLFTAGQTPGQCAVVCTASGITARVSVNITGMLNDAAQQLVADTRTVWGNLDAANRVASLSAAIGPDIIPAPANKFFSDVGKYVFLGNNFFGVMVRQQPGTYVFNTLKDMNPNSATVPNDTGTWKITFSDGWQTEFIRNQDINDQAQFDFKVTATNENQQFHGKFSFLASNLNPSTPNNGDPCQILMNAECYQEINADPLVQSASFVGQVDARGHYIVNEYGTQSYVSVNFDESFVFIGNVDFVFTDGKIFRFDGDWSIKMAVGTTDYIEGTLETADLKVTTGRIEATYQKDMGDNFIPNTFKITNASIILAPNSPDSLTLNGSMSVQLTNAASFDSYSKQTDGNYPCGILDFKGSIATGQNEIGGSLHLERTAYKAAAFTIGYTLNNAGVSRNFTFGATTTDGRTFQFSLNSDWGPAAIEAQLEFAAQGGLDRITNGVVKANNNQVGTLSLDSTGLLRVDYTNGQYETF